MLQFKWTKIAEYRKAAGMTQEELATKVGVMPQQISTWENSPTEKTLTVASLAKIAGAVGKNMDDFFV